MVGRAGTYGISFGVSLGVHALALLVLVTAFSRSQPPLVIPRVRLIYVDPAPPAAPPRGAPDGVVKAASTAPEPVPPKPVVPPKAKVEPKPKPKVVKSQRPLAENPQREPAPAPPAEVAAPPAEPMLAGQGKDPAGAAGGVEGGRAGGTGVMRLGDVASAPVLVTRVVPDYPRRARLAGIEGEVVLEVVVDRHGRVTGDVRVVRSVPELARAAVTAVQRWRFRPARDRTGTAVAVLIEVPVRFVLRDAADASN